MYCDTKPFTISILYVERNAIEENPVYQRESAIWSKDKQELFIDSILCRYDVPKIYFHDLRTKKQLKKYAVIDGKQRLHTIFQFLEDKFQLAKDFKLPPETEYENIQPLMYFSDFGVLDQERFKSSVMDIVLVVDAVEDDIEDLFFRLNNGEPLNAAEKRNAMQGDMNELIREVAQDTFFTKNLRFDNKRYSHYEISAKLLLLEDTEMRTSEKFSDLKKKYLDKLAGDNKSMDKASKVGLLKRVQKNLSLLNRVFKEKDALLNKQAYPPLYYLFIKIIYSEYGDPHLNTLLQRFLQDFQTKRQINLTVEEELRDPALMEFGRLMQQGTNDLNSLKERVSILRRYFLLENPEVKILDPNRQFTYEERYAIYIIAGKKCAECDKELSDLKEMEADHQDQWRFGGKTNLNNARALCQECNRKLGKKMK